MDYNYNESKLKAKQHKKLYHYTTFDKLKCIIENKSLLLRRIDLLNDIIENQNIIDIWKNKVFVASFTHESYESYFFWTTYAKGKSDGIMIEFDNNFIDTPMIYVDAKCESKALEFCDSTDYCINSSAKINNLTWGIRDFALLDVEYIHRNDNIFNETNFLGILKYYEWYMEKETRIRVALRPKGPEMQLINNEYKFIVPDNTELYLKLSNNCLQTMRIILSPFADENLRINVENLLKNNDNNLTIDNKIKNSILTGEV